MNNTIQVLASHAIIYAARWRCSEPPLKAMRTISLRAHNWFHIGSKSMRTETKRKTWAHVENRNSSSCELHCKGKKSHLTHWLSIASEAAVYYLCAKAFIVFTTCFAFCNFKLFLLPPSTSIGTFNFFSLPSSSSYFTAKEVFLARWFLSFAISIVVRGAKKKNKVRHLNASKSVIFENRLECGGNLRKKKNFAIKKFQFEAQTLQSSYAKINSTRTRSAFERISQTHQP